jgi:hypothetical protein
MPKFFNTKDLDFIKTIAEEVVDSVVEQWITLFKMSVGETKTNLYGESLGKVYHAPANLMCIVDREPSTIEYEGYGPTRAGTSTFSFMRHRLRSTDLPYLRDVNGTLIPAGAIQNTTYGYPEIGDIISYDSSYYEIDFIKETQLVGGAPQLWDSGSAAWEDARMVLIATATLTSRTNVQIDERIS